MTLKRTQKRSFILKSDRICVYCKCPCVYDENPPVTQEATQATIDHYIPKVRGGSSGSNNIVLSCMACNRLKSDMTGEEFILFIQTGTLPASYITWLTKRFLKHARQLGRQVGNDEEAED